jgi:uncharacterized protein YjiS (DUF1127 family)
MLDFSTAANTYGFSYADGRRSALVRFLSAVAGWRQRRRLCAELHALNDRMLKDIGISCWEIEAIANFPDRDKSGRVR